MPEDMSEKSIKKSSDRINAGEVAAERWLLPEVNGSHLVTPEKPCLDRAGFHSKSQTTSEPSTTANTLGATPALTQSRLDAIVHESREQGYESGRAKGYEKGYAEGEARALALGQEQTLKQKRQLAELIESVTGAATTHNEQAKIAVVELIAQIAQQLCYRELSIDNSSIAAVVNEAMNALPVGEKHVRLHLNPVDKQLLESISGVMKPEWVIVEDAALQLGGCRIESENSLVDFSISRRLQEIIESSFGQTLVAREVVADPNKRRGEEDDV